MRPGESSTAGFLGKGESLLEIIAADNALVVDELGITHQQLARHLHAMGAVWQLQQRSGESKAVFLYHARRFRVTGRPSRGFQPSPFNDGTKSGTDITVENLDSGRKLSYGLLVPYMVERYGFYGGKGTTYRLNPRDILQVFDFPLRR